MSVEREAGGGPGGLIGLARVLPGFICPFQIVLE